MTLPAAPNPISLSQVNVELGLSATATITMNDAAVRTLAGVGGSGTIISMDNLRGKSSIVLTSPFVKSTAGSIVSAWNENEVADGPGPGSVAASIRFNTNGTIDTIIPGGTEGSFVDAGFQTTWATPAVSNPGTSYYIRANLISTSGTGTIEGGLTTGTWYLIDVNRLYGVRDTSSTFTQILTFNLSKDGSTILSTSPQITLKASYFNSSCVSVNSYVFNYGLAKTMRIGTQLFSTSEDMLIDEFRTIKYANINTQPGVKIVTESGVTLECSTTAPIPTEFNGLVESVDVLGKRVATMRNGIRYWDMVTDVINLGDLEVIHIFADDRCFWAGDTEGSYILHHNAKPLP